MKAIRQHVVVQPGGRIVIVDPSLKPGSEAEIVVLLPEPAGDGAASTVPPLPATDDVPRPGGLPLVDEDGKPVFLPPRDPALPRRPLSEILGSAPSGRTAEEIDRDLRDLRDEWDERFP